MNMPEPYNLSVDELIESQISPPQFGHPLLKYFMFHPEYTNLDNGSFGSLPLPVYHSCSKLSRDIESSPEYFVKLIQADEVKKCRKALAPLLGLTPTAATEDLVLVHNASTGLNTILHNILWDHKDTIVVASTTYNAIERTCTFLADSPPHPTVHRLEFMYPCSNECIVELYKECFEKLTNEKKEMGTGKVVVVLDTITAMPGMYMPWMDIVKIAKQYGVMTVVDGAHSIGQEPNLDLETSGVDFFVSNCHKWLFVKRGCALMYVPKRNQPLIRTSFPTSYAYLSPDDRAKDPGCFQRQYDWNGTFDIVPFLSIIPAIKFRQWLGGEEAIFNYCHNLAIQGGKRLAEILGTELIDTSEGSRQTLATVNVRIPLPDHLPMTAVIDAKFRQKCLTENKVFAPIVKHGGKWWCRVSAQVWLGVSDFEKFAKVVKQACEKIVNEVDEFGLERALKN